MKEWFVLQFGRWSNAAAGAALALVAVTATSCGDNSFKGSAPQGSSKGSERGSEKDKSEQSDATGSSSDGSAAGTYAPGGGSWTNTSSSTSGADSSSSLDPKEPQEPQDGSNPTKNPEVSFQESCASGNVKSDVVVVTIPKNDGYTCLWGQDGNNAKTNGTLAARLERQFPISIPQGRTVCSMKAGSEQQTIRYDDHLFLSLNENILLSNGAGVASLVAGSNGFPQYSWEKLLGLSTADKKMYCAPGVTCQLPKTQEIGAFSFELSEEANKRLFGSLLGKPLNFKLTVTGDNDAVSDCQLNADLKLTVTYTYFQ
jgi:hypothetical protein